MRTAVGRSNGSLKALLFAALLAKVDHENHPFVNLSSDVLRLGLLLDMTDARNKKAGHAGREKVGKGDALGYADFVIEWVQNFKDWY